MLEKLAHKPKSSSEELFVDLDGKPFKIGLKRNLRSRRLTLRLAIDGQSATVTAPNSVTPEEIQRFVNKQRHWLAVRVARMPPALSIDPGSVIPIRGTSTLIRATQNRRGIVELDHGPEGAILQVPGDPSHARRRVVDFLKKQARLDLNDAVAKHADTLSVHPKSIRITDSKSRWGSCSSTRTLSFSWRIIMAPSEVLDYLAAHEVAHLREMNHSQRFWDLVRHICPDMETHKAWLRRNGALLHSVRLD